MKVALTNKLADALGLKNLPGQEDDDSLFSFTANWTNVWLDGPNDMIVLRNHKLPLTIIHYPAKRKDLVDMEEKLSGSIRATLLALNFNPSVVDEYLKLGGAVQFTCNKSRSKASYITKSGTSAAFYVGRASQYPAVYSDAQIGASLNRQILYAPSPSDPKEIMSAAELMRDALAKLTGSSPYSYRAFELEATLDLDLYKATRRFIVPADFTFKRLHLLLQTVYSWKNYHLYDFLLADPRQGGRLVRLIPYEEFSWEEDNEVIMEDIRLDAYLPETKTMTYAYDYGDNWQISIDLIREIAHHDQDSPFLLDAQGKAPPEDVGGIGGYAEFLDIYNDPNHPEHEHMKDWAGYWTPNLYFFGPRLISEC